MSDEQTQQADDPSGDGWRDLGPKELIERGDMFIDPSGGWMESDAIGRTPSKFPNLRHRRRIEQQQPSDSEPVPDNDDDIERAVEERENNMTVTLLDAARRRCRELEADLRTAEEQNAELSALVAEAERSGEQVNAELQQLREQNSELQRETEKLRTELVSLQRNLRPGNQVTTANRPVPPPPTESPADRPTSPPPPRKQCDGELQCGAAEGLCSQCGKRCGRTRMCRLRLAQKYVSWLIDQELAKRSR